MPHTLEWQGCLVYDTVTAQLGLFSRSSLSTLEVFVSREGEIQREIQHSRVPPQNSLNMRGFAPFRCVTHAEIVISVCSGMASPPPPLTSSSPMHKRNSRMDKQEVYGNDKIAWRYGEKEREGVRSYAGMSFMMILQRIVDVVILSMKQKVRSRNRDCFLPSHDFRNRNNAIIIQQEMAQVFRCN